MSNAPKLSSQLEYRAAVGLILCLSGWLLAPGAWAQTFADACNQVSGFMDNLLLLLRVVSVAVVTIAIIFAGFQIAFAHKRVRADRILPHPADPILTQGWMLTVGWSAVDKCRSIAGSLPSWMH